MPLRCGNVPFAARSRNPDEKVAVLPVVLGMAIVEVLSAETSATAGWKAWRLAHVSA